MHELIAFGVKTMRIFKMYAFHKHFQVPYIEKKTRMQKKNAQHVAIVATAPATLQHFDSFECL